MPLWPFRRRSGRKRTRSGANLSDAEAPLRGLTKLHGADADGTARPKKQRLEQQHPSDKLPRRTRAYSFSPGRDDSIRVAGRKDSAPPIPGLSTGPFPADRNDGEQKGDPSWHRAPTLHVHNARHGHGQKKASPRRMNSKRRREHRDREAEIKAMSNYAPVRPAADDWTSGRPIRKQSKRVKTGLGFRRSFENPASDVSLPISIHSSMSSESEFHSFRVSALEALAPRPKLRLSVSPRWGPGQSNPAQQSRLHQQKRKVSERVPESVVRAHRRVDSFADDLDAADLRELMERDNRRRERRRQRDQERIERRLTTRAEKQREAAAEARKSGSPPPVNMERGVLGRELGLGTDPANSAVVTSTKRRSSSSLHRPSRTSLEHAHDAAMAAGALQTNTASHPEPMDTDPAELHRTSSIQPDIPITLQLPDREPEPVPESAFNAKSTPKKSMKLRRSFLRSKKSRSRSPNVPDQDFNAVSPLSSRQDETSRKTSESSIRARISFSALFRWGNRKRRNSGPSSFSNTSREEMQAAAAQAKTQIHSHGLGNIPTQALPTEDSQAQTVPPSVNYIPRKVSSGVPKRTRSRFREDLPELPLSPPDSRLGSPEADEPPLPIVSEAIMTDHARQQNQSDAPAAAIVERHDTPTSDIRRVDEKMEKLEKMRQTPTSLRHSIQPSPDAQAVSLASIDSEGSWLSGRINRRSSGMRATSMQRFQLQTTRSISPSTNDTEEDLADDEYLSNLASPSREMLADDERTPRKSTGDALPSSDDDDMMDESELKWGSVERLRATTVTPRQRVKSSEILINGIDQDESTSSLEPPEGETPKLQRATSVSLSKGHARHVSSGSTNMLQVSPPPSFDQRRTNDEVF
ncbi:hypothetical protein C8035_v004169 [Colletotrichum spinosum]|uniref:Uncharacterized protein n=1 Tax=Colletotrichum spinosum TaxID=1347390 RepID=A0A4R8QN11_9PEZI|nr:hypothetical protein C8035_v004169 [Colletotrichum spinosum]